MKTIIKTIAVSLGVALFASCTDSITINGKDKEMYELEMYGVDSFIVANDERFSIHSDGVLATYVDPDTGLEILFKSCVSYGNDTRYYKIR